MTNSPTNLENAERAEMEPKVKIKPLVWTDAKDRGYSQANCALGQYQVSWLGEFECWQCCRPHRAGNNWYQNFSQHPSKDDAKAAAQQDFASRIRSCLLDKPEAVEVEQLRAENAKLKKIIASCQWHWPADDTSSEMCSDGPWEIAENCDVRPGEVFAYSRGGVVETRWYGFLPAADDADSDDEFTVDEATEDTAAAKMNAEIARRAALTQEPTHE